MSEEVQANMVVGRRLMARLQGLAAFERTPEMERAKRQIGALALTHQRQHFREAAGGNGEWPPLGDITVILRPGQPKIFEPKDIAVKRAGLKILQKTNRLYMSLTPAAPGNVYDIGPDFVRVGTNVQHAARLSKGGETTFEWTEAKAAQFAKNMSMTKRGRKRPKRRADGRRWSWKKRGKTSPWNEWFFKMRNWLRKSSGRTFHVPARPIVRKPKPEWTRAYTGLVSAAIKRLTQR